MGKIKLMWNDEVLFEGSRTDAVDPAPAPTIYTCLICGLQFGSQKDLSDHVASIHPTPVPQPPPAPPVEELGSKTNPRKLNIPYEKVTNGFVALKKGSEFGLGSGAMVYFEVDPAMLKPDSAAFQMVIKGMNCPTLSIFKAYLNKTTGILTDDIFFTTCGCIDYVRNNAHREFDTTKFLYGLKNEGEAWGIQIWVQMLM